MDIPQNALVLVADGGKMLLFRNAGDVAFPNLEVVAHEQQADPATSDIGTDAPGSNQIAGATMKSDYEATDFHQQAEDRFAADAAEMLKRRVLRHEFDKLIVVAPPKTLGEIRKHYHKEVESRLAGEIAKDLVNRSTDEIAKVIAAS